MIILRKISQGGAPWKFLKASIIDWSLTHEKPFIKGNEIEKLPLCRKGGQIHFKTISAHPFTSLIESGSWEKIGTLQPKSREWEQLWILGSSLYPVHIPMFDRVRQMELTIPTSLGWEPSNPFTEIDSPCKDSLRSYGFFSSRVAS